MSSDILHTILIVAVSALVTLALRAFPFLLFSGKEMPVSVKKVADLLPPAIMGVLVVYCLKSYIVAPDFSSIAALVAVVAVVIIHLWKKNVLLSIFLGTAIYMLMI